MTGLKWPPDTEPSARISPINVPDIAMADEIGAAFAPIPAPSTATISNIVPTASASDRLNSGALASSSTKQRDARAGTSFRSELSIDPPRPTSAWPAPLG
jgi:hypothetical protein